MIRKLLSILLLAALLTGGALFLDEGGNGQEKKQAEWTFMVYLDSDNNLEDSGIADFNEMEAVGSTDRVNIIVQMDRAEGYDSTNGDWTGARRFSVEKDNDPVNINSPMLQDLGEVNMGDPDELASFTDWSISNFPARRYALVLWDHGGAFRGVCYDDKVPGSDTYDMINMTELRQAAEKTYVSAGNRKIDLWGFDACLMAEVAVQYELKDFVKVGVSSGYSEPNDGWPYTPILDALIGDPTMDEREFAKEIVRDYIHSYNDRQEDPQDYPMVTQAAFDMDKMNNFTTVLDQFSEELASPGPLGGLEYFTQIYLARKNCNSYDSAAVFTYDLTGYPMYDVIDFTYKLEDYIQSAFPKNSRILSLCKDLREAIQGTSSDPGFMFYAEADKWHPDANGLSMYFPNRDSNQISITQLPTNYLLSYEDTDFTREHLWDEFLHAYYGIEPIEDSMPTITITGPDFNTTVESSDILTITGIAYDREMVDRVEIRVDGDDWTALPGITGQGKVVWFHQMDITMLSAGTHTIEARARDRPANTEPGTPGHITLPVSTQINIEEARSSTSTGFTIPNWVATAFMIMIIAAALTVGVLIFRGRTG